MRLISATGRPLAALALLAVLCACATTASAPPTPGGARGWRIVERTGEARYLPPERAAWFAATTGQALAGGSQVATGPGGRLIVDAPGRHLSVGPDSRFVLPEADRDAWLEQRAGWLRYRIARTGARPFRIHTRSLELEVASGVVDVHVDHLATEVTVKEGQVRVATPDGLRQTQMLAGHSARAGEPGAAALAVRLAPAGPLQPIEPVVLPALRPKRAPAGTAAAGAAGASRAALPAALGAPPLASGGAALAGRPATPATAAPPVSVPALTPASPAGAGPLVLRQSTAAGGARVQPAPSGPPPAKAIFEKEDTGLPRAGSSKNPGALAGSAPRVRATAPATRPDDPEAIRRGKFERLTAGALEGIQPPHPAPSGRGSIR